MYALDITGKGVPQMSSSGAATSTPETATPSGTANRNR
jgi:hypothetical protein